MTRWLALTAFTAALGLAVLRGTSPAAEGKQVSPRVDALDLLILAEKPVRLELRVETDGMSVPAMWDATFAQMLVFYDRNGDGILNPAEAEKLPSAFALRQVLWGQITPFVGVAPGFASLDLNGDGTVSGDELADYYRRAGLGGVLVGVGKPIVTEQLTDALLKHLDTNQDGSIDEAEWKAAPTSLRKLDKNDDELVGPGELVEKILYPGATGAILCSAPSPTSQSDPTTDALPLIVLPLRTIDTHWVSVVADRREKTKVTAIKSDALAALRQASPTATWNVHLGTVKQDVARLQAAGEKQPADARLRLSTDGIRLELRTDEGRLQDQTVAACKRFTALFAELDADADDTLDEAELGTPKAGPLKQMAATADRNGDGQLTKKEFNAWLDLQEQIAKGHVLLSILDHGSGLFEFLDVDHDGSLSVRDLRAAWSRLNEAGCVNGKQFDRAKLPRQLLAVLSHGHPQTTIGKPVRSGPAWFLAMDRNVDGDVTIKEWVGDLDLFRKWEADGDGLLSATEAVMAPTTK